MKFKTWVSTSLFVGMFAFGSAAQAALVPCGTGSAFNLLNKVPGATDCQYLSPFDSSNVASITNINAAKFFGANDWVEIGKTEITGDGQSGTWSLTNPEANVYEYIVVFKAGSGTNLVAFRLNITGNTSASGRWTSPFTSPPFDISGSGAQDVSHYTIARHRRGNTAP
jgi:hypothetical protein